ncbi:DUF3089 domain-containing protein [Sphingomonas sp. CARO-RG-8B-R24-01]|uniref:DUF3089 domain-containing protein n=1 Tax=Sphingomonas sp. CARO-RG-8B-R24-01 TaxID=2914831 RepID=UPI001F56273B|nr:DUF3089 domain-containing protein [Sphingomonas sp. CARO-RG-8B-R24-01]
MKSLAAILLATAAPTVGAAQAPATASADASPKYESADAWLCRPGRVDACAANQDATIIRADGSRSIEHFARDESPKFDCFYVYPTVSLDPTPNSDLVAGREEQVVAAFQAGRFAKHCRVFAPLYRQVTLGALREAMLGKPMRGDRALAYADVKAAWDEYLAYDNHGRGVVLVGHSQGSGILKELVSRAIEGTPVQRQIISVIIPGTNVAVPADRDVGGDLKSTPLCHSNKDTGCFVSYTSFRAEAPPPSNSRFGIVPQPDMVAACVDPAALDGKPKPTDAYLGARGAGLASAAQGPWSNDGAAVTTTFVKVPGLLSTRCASSGRFRYLAVTTNANPADKRTDHIVGDVVVGGKILADWGLHLVDLPVVMGDLVELSNDQAKAWLAKNPPLPAG